MADPLLDIRALQIRYGGTPVGIGPVDLAVGSEEIFGLVGESGSGKTTLGMGILSSLPASAKITGGTIRFAGKDLTAATDAEWGQIRWKQLAYIPQGAMNALNPVARIRRQFADLVGDHTGARLKGKWLEKVESTLEAVGLKPDALRTYPHELSGGMKQRVCIAMAVLFEPMLIVADEPTSALDVISQRTVLQTLAGIRASFKTSILLVGHDMAVQAQVADRIGILFAGRFVEVGTTKVIFSEPRHPYTRRLIESVPSIRRKRGLSAAVLWTEEERASWNRENDRMVEVQPGHFVRLVEAGEG